MRDLYTCSVCGGKKTGFSTLWCPTCDSKKIVTLPPKPYKADDVGILGLILSINSDMYTYKCGKWPMDALRRVGDLERKLPPGSCLKLDTSGNFPVLALRLKPPYTTNDLPHPFVFTVDYIEILLSDGSVDIKKGKNGARSIAKPTSEDHSSRRDRGRSQGGYHQRKTAHSDGQACLKLLSLGVG